MNHLCREKWKNPYFLLIEASLVAWHFETNVHRHSCVRVDRRTVVEENSPLPRPSQEIILIKEAYSSIFLAAASSKVALAPDTDRHIDPRNQSETKPITFFRSNHHPKRNESATETDRRTLP